MGGQSTEPRPFLSDKNPRGSTNGGSEKLSDSEGDRRRDKSRLFNDELAPGVMTSRSDKIENISVQNYASGVRAYLYLQDKANENLCKWVVLGLNRAS